MKNIIKFYPDSEYVKNVYDPPIPAVKQLPEWWKKMPKYQDGSKKLTLVPFANITAKQCAPIFDAMSAGYYLTLPADILVTRVNGEPLVTWLTSEVLLEVWDPVQISTYEISNNFSNTVFKFLHGWIIETPPGWSTMFVNPFGYNNSNIWALPGIVDTDLFQGQINCPFVIDKNFEGVIEKGTPIVQVLPFKRANWAAEYPEYEDGHKTSYSGEKIKTKLYKYYSSIREKKRYS